MKITVIGATGFVGAKLVAEAVARGHDVTALSRSGTAPAGAQGVAADVRDTAALTRAFADCDAVLHAYAPPKRNAIAERIARQTEGTASIIAAVKAAGVRRVLAVGGAGTLEVAPGVRFMDSYLFPSIWLGGARSTAVIKDMLAAETAFDWTCLSPPNALDPGTRTGHYRSGLDRIITDDTGRSTISVDDYAVAMIDELENPQHTGRRFTVGY